MDGVEALVFDVFGTVVDWRSSVENELQQFGKKHSVEGNWGEFAQEWRLGYINNTRRIAAGDSGSLNVDQMHREILDSMLDSPRWEHLGRLWDDAERESINGVWHRLNGWPDATEGLYALKKHTIITTLSNGNVKLLIDMAKHADLPWDAIFSTELFGSYKPHPNAYLGAIRHLSLPPEKCAMVASHIFDLRAAAGQGMKTVYIQRPREEWDSGDIVKTKEEGGEVDLVIKSFVELAGILGKRER